MSLDDFNLIVFIAEILIIILHLPVFYPSIFEYLFKKKNKNIDFGNQYDRIIEHGEATLSNKAMMYGKAEIIIGPDKY